MSRLEYVLPVADQEHPDEAVAALAAALRRDLIPLGVWVVLRRPGEAPAGLNGDCDGALQRQIDSIAAAVMAAHRRANTH